MRSSSAAAEEAAASATAAPASPKSPTSTELPTPSFVGMPTLDEERELDLVIEGGRVVDGSGSRATPADVAVDDGRIVHVGELGAKVKARRRVNARGLVVAPGFIDLHAHGDPEDGNRNELAMGVTTICVGQDGRSVADAPIRRLAAKLGKKKLAVNVVPFVGHATVRELEGVNLDDAPSSRALERMTKRVARELSDGAFGLTTGLEYQPGARAPRAELVALAKAVAAADGLVMSHLRSEDDDAIDAALDELFAQGSEGGARVHVSHLKVVYGKGEARAVRLLDRLAEARGRGLRVTADLYPYEASYTTIGIVFPDFAKPPHAYTRVRRERREELAAYLRERVERRGGPEATLFGSDPYRGKTLAALAEEAGTPFEDVLLRIGPNGASAAYFVMDPALQARLLVDPNVMFGTDGSATSHHPRGHGTFARVIREFVVEKAHLPLEEAVRKMSGMAATTLRLDSPKRGLVAKDHAADLVVFDPREIRDEATYTKPHALAKGMRWVFVNGVAAIADGKATKARGGVLLRRR